MAWKRQENLADKLYQLSIHIQKTVQGKVYVKVPFFFYQKWYIKVKGLELGVEPPTIIFVELPPLPPHQGIAFEVWRIFQCLFNALMFALVQNANKQSPRGDQVNTLEQENGFSFFSLNTCLIGDLCYQKTFTQISNFFCANSSSIRRGFRAGVRSIRYSVNKANLRSGLRIN